MTDVLIELDNVSVTRGGRRILDGVSWTLRAGENWAVLGGNGAGKSTLLRLLRGDIWPDHSDGQRTYFFDGAATFSPFRAKENIALVSFEHQAKYWRQEWPLSGRELLHTGFFGSDLLHQKPDAAQVQHAENVAMRLGIAPLLDAGIQRVSQGELRKLLIARALLAKPRILILDEFCAGLDAFSRRAMLDFLETLAHGGTQLICSTHRREELVPSLQNVLLLHGGAVARTYRGGFEREGRAEKPEAKRESLHVLRSHRFPADDEHDFLLRVVHANVILDEKPILHDINWEMKPGEHWAILGANGSGKSTFLKMLLGEIWPARGGSVHRFGNAAFPGLWKIKEKIGFVSHEFQSKYHEVLSARDAVLSGFFHSVGLIDQAMPAQQQRAEELLAWLEIAHLAERPFQGLSTGEARKILLARALVNHPLILLLDEPFDGLDEASREFLTARFAELAGHGTHFVLVSHHEADFPPFLTHELVLENGRTTTISHR